MKRGDVYIVDLNDSIGSEQKGTRPGIVVQNNAGNFTSNTLVIVPMSTSDPKLKSHVKLESDLLDIKYDSTVLCEQIRVIDKSRLKYRILTLPQKIMAKIEKGIKTNLALD